MTNPRAARDVCFPEPHIIRVLTNGSLSCSTKNLSAEQANTLKREWGMPSVTPQWSLEKDGSQMKTALGGYYL